MTTPTQQDQLLRLAQASIAHGAHHGECRELTADELPGFLGEQRATFVTVYKDGELDGCIGSIQPRRPLGRDVVHNAFMAAFEDPRFGAVRVEELDLIEVHISLLSPLRAVEVADEQQLVAMLEPGVHGVLLECHGRRGTLLPSVWEKCADPALFVSHVKRKAGLPADYWHEEMRAFVYTVEMLARS